MRLADFILANREPILAEWEVFARSISAGATLTALALRDHADEILLATAGDMITAQSRDERASKSKGRGSGSAGRGSAGLGLGSDADTAANADAGPAAAADDASLNGASELHATGRLGYGFDLLDVVSEYRALRASVLQLWRDSAPDAHDRDVDDLTRFNESIDQSLAKAVSSYTRRVNQSRDMFLAILSHDLRNPLNSIAMCAELLPRLRPIDAEYAQCTAQITSGAAVMGRMIADLLDYTRTRLGAGMPVAPAPMDLAALGRELFEEFRAAHPTRDVRFQAHGDLRGDWDADCLRQAVSNLMGNAIQHGAADAPVTLTMGGDGERGGGDGKGGAGDGKGGGGGRGARVWFEVHNGGPPIPPGELPKIFDPLIRGSSTGTAKVNRPGSIGLGLYIAREIARSHGGSIDVTSTQADGTAFTIRLPRHPDIHTGRPILDEQHIVNL